MARRELERAPARLDQLVHPGHDYVGQATSTIGEEKAKNPLFRERDRVALESRLSRRLSPPADMAQILRHNLADSDSPAISAWELAALRASLGGGALVDVRSPLEFESEHIEGSLNVPLASIESRLGELPEQGELFVICRVGVRSIEAAETLARHGRKPRVLEGGIAGWRKAGFPLREGRRRLPIDRQVQLIVGSAVVASTALGAFVSPWLLFVAGFFGSGLLFAGVSGTCGLALMLGRMPWNRSPVSADAGGSGCAAPTCSAGR